jgi:hypothetical protein
MRSLRIDACCRYTLRVWACGCGRGCLGSGKVAPDHGPARRRPSPCGDAASMPPRLTAGLPTVVRAGGAGRGTKHRLAVHLRQPADDRRSHPVPSRRRRCRAARPRPAPSPTGAAGRLPSAIAGPCRSCRARRGVRAARQAVTRGRICFLSIGLGARPAPPGSSEAMGVSKPQSPT